MSLTDLGGIFQGAQTPSEIAARQALTQQQQIANQQTLSGLNALQGYNYSDTNSVNRTTNALVQAGMFDWAKAANDVAYKRAITEKLQPLTVQGIEQSAQQQQGAQGGGYDMQRHASLLQDGLTAIGDILSTKTPEDQQAEIGRWRSYFQGENVDPDTMNEIFPTDGNVTREALLAHQGRIQQELQDVRLKMRPGFATASQFEQNWSPWLQAGAASAGYDLGPALATAENITNPLYNTQVQAAYAAPIAAGTAAGGIAGQAAMIPSIQDIAKAESSGRTEGTPGQLTDQNTGAVVPGFWSLDNGQRVFREGQIQAAPAGGAAGAAPPAQPARGPSVTHATSLAGGAASNVQQANQFEIYSNGYLPRVTNLRNLRTAASTIPTGPNAPFWTLLGQLKQEYPALRNLPIGPNATGTANFEEVRKVAQMVMAQQQDIMGLPKTNQSVDITSGATPHEENTPLGIQRLTGILAGNEDYINAERQAWNAWKAQPGHDQSTFQDFVGGGPKSWNKVFDPRVFQAQYMDAAQKAVVRNAVGPKRFDLEEGAARRLGLLGG